MPFVLLNDLQSTKRVENQMNAAGKYQQNVLSAAQMLIYN